uniref:Uncharacterized protein n=1 Tax=Chromera velia CCMP2878 TaxID=1169474 RepID=A0A0G4F0W7_9ALVE|eukprot:Cvel_14499.t1-p1 / transcript=Cvel_14499.t1 / gene=Cvel_14499 / organism=Chromera_velia_CCMP2878 / gene_product=hypothetical protein / transcript_product=hypothetical protein / location=Cvel_scaffold1034:14022-16791(-) / protein_length=230 / sequence_SO=supercontig / SO=protein_coding / is_pseudo=false
MGCGKKIAEAAFSSGDKHIIAEAKKDGSAPAKKEGRLDSSEWAIQQFIRLLHQYHPQLFMNLSLGGVSTFDDSLERVALIYMNRDDKTYTLPEHLKWPDPDYVPAPHYEKVSEQEEKDEEEEDELHGEKDEEEEDEQQGEKDEEEEDEQQGEKHEEEEDEQQGEKDEEEELRRAVGGERRGGGRRAAGARREEGAGSKGISSYVNHLSASLLLHGSRYGCLPGLTRMPLW